ncbi:hypothetical protein GCM10009863_34330 [Streptomyces axinellae]|uniref:Uncharacterized protein n=1 Tax=Streptomyces axinellae TaxID=552788 RepID=A0ABP6CLE1_9ACTN
MVKGWSRGSVTRVRMALLVYLPDGLEDFPLGVLQSVVAAAACYATAVRAKRAATRKPWSRGPAGYRPCARHFDTPRIQENASAGKLCRRFARYAPSMRSARWTDNQTESQ